MALEQLGNLGEFVAAIAVVVSIFYLAVQMRQNTATVEAAAYQTWLTAKQELYSFTRDPHFSQIVGPALADSRSLTEEHSTDGDSHEGHYIGTAADNINSQFCNLCYLWMACF